MKLVDNVTVLPVITTLSIPVERILDAAKGKELTSVVIIGYEPDGTFYLASSEGEAGNTMLDLERAKTVVLRAAIGDRD